MQDYIMEQAFSMLNEDKNRKPEENFKKQLHNECLKFYSESKERTLAEHQFVKAQLEGSTLNEDLEKNEFRMRELLEDLVCKFSNKK